MDADARFMARPLAIIPFVLFTLIFGPLPEEMGWRGYGLEHLQRRLTALPANLIVGTVWALWHLPLFFLEGTYQSSLGVGTAHFFLFMTGLLPQSVLIAWIYNSTDRSTLSAVLFHFMINLTGEVLTLPHRAEYHRALWAALAAGAVVLLFGYRTLGRKTEN